MEKRRRARINSSLNELKNLILDTYKNDVNVSISIKEYFLFRVVFC